MIAPSAARVDLLDPPKPGHQGRIEARAGRGTSHIQFDLEKKVFPFFPDLKPSPIPSSLKTLASFSVSASGALLRTSTDGRKLRSRLTIF